MTNVLCHWWVKNGSGGGQRRVVVLIVNSGGCGNDSSHADKLPWH